MIPRTTDESCCLSSHLCALLCAPPFPVVLLLKRKKNYLRRKKRLPGSWTTVFICKEWEMERQKIKCNVLQKTIAKGRCHKKSTWISKGVFEFSFKLNEVQESAALWMECKGDILLTTPKCVYLIVTCLCVPVEGGCRWQDRYTHIHTHLHTSRRE